MHRLRVVVDGWERSLIVKWSDPVVARRSRLVARRWLPAVGLERPGAAAARRRRGARTARGHGRSTRTSPVDRCRRTNRSTARSRRRSTRSLACIRPSRSTHCSVSAACGAAIAGFTSTPPTSATPSSRFTRSTSIAAARTRSRLATRCSSACTASSRQEPERAQVLAAVGGPDTLLHGDLWPTNAIVLIAAATGSACA